jgi:hypothetical protein
MPVGGAREIHAPTQALRGSFAKTRSMRGFQREPPPSCRPPIIRRRRHPGDAMEHSRAAMRSIPHKPCVRRCG